ncbi:MULTISPECIES: hypothetical protein [Streptomyces]|uniref:Uncharacterized protein n=1 Tax=Streptomyces ramulosus TaxID=47762 RepID=A0ABW1FAD7_9ACTN
MAGPYGLAPNEVKGGIPTWAGGRETTVKVECEADGRFEMTAGGSPTETSDVKKGSNEFKRGFGGVTLSVKNLTDKNMTVSTE